MTGVYIPKALFGKQDKAVHQLSQREVQENFWSHSTVHGYPHIAKERGVCKKLFWTLTSLGASGVLLYQVISLAVVYFKYEVTVDIEWTQHRELDFPAISVCNINPVKKSKLYLSDRLSTLLAKWGLDDLEWRRKRRRKREVSSPCTTTILPSTGLCYWMVTKEHRFTEALAKCQTGGGTLLHLTSPEVNTFLDKHGFIGTRKLYIGLTDQRVEGQWEWVNGSDLDWSNWRSDDHEPNGVSRGFYSIQISSKTHVYKGHTTFEGTYDNCVVINRQGTWNTKPCSDDYSFVCQSTLEPETTQAIVEDTTESHTTGAANVERNVFREEPLREDFRKQSDFLEELADEEDEIKREMGYTYSEFVLYCRFQGKECQQTDFGYLFDSLYGNCYVFNSGWNWNISRPFYTSSRTGSSLGLQLLLNIQQDEYLKGVSQGAGVSVTIHPQSRMPFPADEGYLVLPGHLTSISIKKISVSRLSGDYGICLDSSALVKDRDVFQELFPVRYSTASCYKTCYQQHVISQCHCADPQYPMYGSAFPTIEYQSCDNRNISQDRCMYFIETQYIKDELECDCPQPCSEVRYSAEISKGLWPPIISQQGFAEKYNTTISLSNGTSIAEFMARNILRIKINYEQLNSESIDEKPKYLLVQYWGNVGTNLSLWLGCSFITTFEFLEYVMDMLMLAIIKYYTKSSSKLTVKETFSNSRKHREPRVNRVSVSPGHGKDVVNDESKQSAPTTKHRPIHASRNLAKYANVVCSPHGVSDYGLCYQKVLNWQTQNSNHRLTSTDAHDSPDIEVISLESTSAQSSHATTSCLYTISSVQSGDDVHTKIGRDNIQKRYTHGGERQCSKDSSSRYDGFFTNKPSVEDKTTIDRKKTMRVREGGIRRKSPRLYHVIQDSKTNADNECADIEAASSCDRRETLDAPNSKAVPVFKSRKNIVKGLRRANTLDFV